MRLVGLDLRNWRTFRDARVDFGPTTVIVGPNDVGKTGLAEAIDALFEPDHDEGLSLAWTDVRQHSTYDIDDEVLEPSYVLGRFGELTDLEAQVYRYLVHADDVVRCSSLFDASHENGVSCVVLTPEQVVELRRLIGDRVSITRTSWEPLHRDGDHLWLPWSVLGAALDHPDPPWTDPRPARGVELPVPLRFRLMRLPGPEAGAPDVEAWLHRFVRTAAMRQIGLDMSRAREGGSDDLEEWINVNPKIRRSYSLSVGSWATMDLNKQFRDPIQRAIGLVGAAYSEAAGHYIQGVDGAEIFHDESASVRLDRIVDALIDEYSVELYEVTHVDDESVPMWRSTRELGAGARRAAALATLELLRDPAVNDPDSWRVVVVEEPEVGLHPAAQRKAAANLAALATHGIQTVVVTHSPIFVSAVPVDALRVARTTTRMEAGAYDDTTLWRDSTIDAPASLSEVSEVLGLRPSDVLMSSAFVVVEGESDAAILKVLSRTNGADLDRLGITVLPASGTGTVRTVAEILKAVYADVPIMVVLDNGSQTASLKVELDARFGQRLSVHLLDVTEIEGHLAAKAVERWLRANGADDDVLDSDELRRTLEAPGRKRVLRKLAASTLQRDYRVVEDGVAIAGMMRESEIRPSLRHLLTQVAGLRAEST